MKRTIDETLEKIYDLAFGNAPNLALEDATRGQMRKRMQQIKACVRSYREAQEDADLNRLADERQDGPFIPVTLDQLDAIAITETAQTVLRQMTAALAEAGIDIGLDSAPVYTSTVVEDPATGELVLTFPPEMLERLGWGEGTVLVWEVEGEHVTLRKQEE